MRGASLMAAAALACCAAICALFACADVGDVGGGGLDAAPDTTGDDAGAPSDDASGSDSGTTMPVVLFSDDFERSPQQTMGAWDATEAVSGAVLIEANSAASGTSSLGVDVQAQDAGATADLRRTFTLPQGTTFVVLEVALHYETLPSHEIHAVALRTGSGNAAFLEILPTEFRFAEQPTGAAYKDYPIGGMTSGAWHFLRIVLDASKKPAHATIDIDTARRLDTDLTLDFSQLSPLDVFMGVTFAANATMYDLNLDAVRLSVR